MSAVTTAGDACEELSCLAGTHALGRRLPSTAERLTCTYLRVPDTAAEVARVPGWRCLQPSRKRPEHTMSLTAFIRDHHEEIIREFAVFAKTLMPRGADMTEAELRDHAEEILAAVVQDIDTPQTSEEESRKSKGRGSAKIMEASGRLHADDRIQHGFTFRSVLAEFRALRATVLRLYAESGASDLIDVGRFNEAIDEAMTESMDRFAVQTDLFRDQFIGVLSHDLRTPLGAITAGAALLAVPEDNPQRRSRVVARIMSSAQRMERMIGDLLDLTRTRLGGSIPLKRRPADLEHVCEEAIMEIRAGQPDAVLRWQGSGDLRGEWDADRLTQVVSNLVANAIQHGGGTPITFTAQEDRDSVTLAIHNGGPPIPADVLPLIFEPLARGHGDGTGGRIGLGLFIARAIVSAHGGNIHVSSSSDAGTTFTVALPKGF
jgi:signal transduction histidine kinase